MSYNITNWETHEIKNVIIPKGAFFLSNHTDWHPMIKKHEPGSDGGRITVDFFVPGCVEMNGTEYGTDFFLKSVEIYGEGSGTCWHEIIQPALEVSVGYLSASVVWEAGDCIERLIVENGKVEFKKVDFWA
jgi:hypothetical protein